MSGRSRTETVSSPSSHWGKLTGPGLPSNKNNNNSEQKELQLRATKAINHFERKGQAESEKMEPDLCPSLMVAHQRDAAKCGCVEVCAREVPGNPWEPGHIKQMKRAGYGEVAPPSKLLKMRWRFGSNE
ncbi:hypothetical protein ACLKA6_015061 [Drosophila palustris]